MQPKITVGELKTLLARFKDDEEIYVAHPAHDYLRRYVASPVLGADYMNVEYSEYFRQSAIVDKKDEWEGREVLVLFLQNMW